MRRGAGLSFRGIPRGCRGGLKFVLKSGSAVVNTGGNEMDIKAKIDEIVNKVKSDPNFADKFKKEPIKASRT